MSETELKRLYEAMFLIDPNKANKDWNAVTEHVHGIITRNGGDIANSEKWDERKLAYPLNEQTRATYILVHFNAPPSQMETIQRSYQLSDLVIRVLILQDEDGITSEVKSLSDEPTDPVRSTRRERNVSLPDTAIPRGAEVSEEQNKEEAESPEETEKTEKTEETEETEETEKT